MVWTHFWDMHSGGSQKLDWSHIYIEAPEEEARAIFYNRFKRNPARVTCSCCGADYSVDEELSLSESTAYHRNCADTFFDSNGNEVSREEAWVFGTGLKKGYSNKYVERPRVENVDCIPLENYLTNKEILVIRADEIMEQERHAEIPQEGWVWIEWEDEENDKR